MFSVTLGGRIVRAMQSKRDLEIAAQNWMIRCEQERERVAKLEHALNLLVNESGFGSRRSAQKTEPFTTSGSG